MKIKNILMFCFIIFAMTGQAQANEGYNFIKPSKNKTLNLYRQSLLHGQGEIENICKGTLMKLFKQRKKDLKTVPAMFDNDMAFYGLISQAYEKEMGKKYTEQNAQSIYAYARLLRKVRKTDNLKIVDFMLSPIKSGKIIKNYRSGKIKLKYAVSLHYIYRINDKVEFATKCYYLINPKNQKTMVQIEPKDDVVLYQQLLNEMEKAEKKQEQAKKKAEEKMVDDFMN